MKRKIFIDLFIGFFKGEYMKIKKNKTLLLILISLVILCLVPLYNHVLCPFEGYNKDILFHSENYDLNYEEELRTFYDNHVCYYRYEEKYATKFYYKFGKKSLMSFITLVYFYSMESYSYIVSLDDDYDDMKEKMLNGTRLISTPIGYGDYSFENNFNVNGSVYNEIYMNVHLDLEDIYLNNIRTRSYWLSYNDEKKEIGFSCVFHFEPISRKNRTDFEKWLSYQFE